MGTFHLVVLPGDGIGPEVIEEAVQVLRTLEDRFGHRFELTYDLIGGCAIDEYGTALRPETLARCRKADAVLLGAVGGPKWSDPRAPVRPEDGLLAIRKGLGLFVNLRPVKVYPSLAHSSSLKPTIVRDVDLVVVRELTGGLYFARPKGRRVTSRGRKAVDTMGYSEKEIQRILRAGFEVALRRRKKLTSVDKANILESSRLWREIAMELSAEYPEVTLEHMLVDNCAMQLVRNPAQFDVIVTENTFGDILSDEAAVLAGSLGMLPSASLAGIPGPGRKALGLYEPVHGSAPDIAGKGIANPLATILSVALMLRYSLGLEREAQAVEKAVEQALEEGYRTRDIAAGEGKIVGTSEMGQVVRSRIVDQQNTL